MNSNISGDSLNNLADLFRLLGQPARTRILLTISGGKTCVCHLEAVLGLRQAAISQHLMALRDAGLVQAERDGRFIFYQLANPALLDAVRLFADCAGLAGDELTRLGRRPVSGCPCPICNPQGDSTCKKP